MAGNIGQFDAGNLKLNPTETGVDARAKVGQRIGAFFNQQASGEDILARETQRLAGQTEQVGSETGRLGAQIGSETADVGRRVGSSITEAGDAAVKYMDHQQISQGAPAFANLMAKATQDWNNTLKNADPNDPTIAPKFIDSLNAQLDQFKDKGFYTEGGQAWAEAHVDALRQHLTETTQADMANKAKEATTVNLQQMNNSLSSNVHNDPSKSNLDFSIAAMKSGLEGMISSSPNLNAAQVDHVRGELSQKGMESLIKSNAIGYIEKTGQLPPWINDPKYAPYVNGAELKTLENAAKTQTKSNELTQKQIEKTNRELADLNVHKAATDVLNKNVSFDPTTGKPVVNPNFFSAALDIARKNPNAPSAAATARTMLDWGESQMNKEKKITDDPATRQALTDRLFDPDHPTTRQDLMKAQVDGKLSDHSFQSMERLVTELEQSPLKGPVWQDTVAAVKDELILSNVGLPGKDITGATNYAKWAQTFIPQYLAKSRAGTLPDNALDVKDPTSMISQSMAPFKRDLNQRINDYLSVLGKADATEGGAKARTFGGVPVPAPLSGVAAIRRNPNTGEWRDETTGKIYNKDGSPK